MKKIIAALLLLSLVLYGTGFYLNKKLNNFVMNLSEKITQEIGHPVTISKITNKWDWFYLKINLSDLVVFDKSTNIPLFRASSIVGTVDAIESVLSLNLKFRHLLLRSPRLVVQWDGKNSPLVLGLGGEHVAGRIDPKILLDLLSMQRKINIVNGDLHLQGIENADLPFMNLTLDFVERSKYEYNLVARGSVAAAVPPEFSFAMNYIGDLKDFSKAMMDFELNTSNLKIRELANFVPAYKQDFVTGDFKDLDIKGTIQNGSLRTIRSNFALDNLVVNKDTLILSGEGKFEFKPFKNKYNVTMSNLKIVNTELYSYPINVDLIRTEIIGIFDPATKEWDLKTDSLEIKLLDMKLKSMLKMKIKPEKQIDLELDSKFSESFSEQLLQLLPDNLVPNDLQGWLNKSIVDGRVDTLKVRHQDHNTFCELALNQAELQYASEWPSIKNVDATITYDKGQMQIVTTKAEIQQTPVNSLVTSFPIPFDTRKSLINIDGNMAATLEAGLNFLNQTPLKLDIADRIKEFNPIGSMQLDLNLQISLKDDPHYIAVRGKIDLQQAKIDTPDVALALTNITGKVNFTNNTLRSEHLDLEVFNHKATATLALDADKSKGLQISVVTPLSVEDLRQSFANLDLAHVSGTTKVLANLSIPWDSVGEQRVLTLKSDLQGITLSYPEPFNKAAATKLPLKLTYLINGDKTQNIYLKLASLVDTNFNLSNGNIKSGHISFGLNNAVLTKTNNLIISGKLDVLNAEQWQPLLQSTSILRSLPVALELFVDKLYFNGNKWNAMWIKYDSPSNKWSLENQLIKGTFHFAGEEKVDVRLERLDLETTEFKNNEFVNFIENKRKDNNLPLIQFYCEQLRINKRDYRKVSFQLLPRLYGYEITEFAIANADILVQAQGQWQMGAKEFTQLSGNAFTNNFGKALDSWGYNNSVARGTGEVNFSMQWDGNPANFDILKLEGASHVDLRSGSLTGVNPGLGRVIGLLSFESIQRRLKLDFSDLISKGFAFDKLSSDLKLRPGIASSENILINGPSARIELSGKTNLKSQELDFIMFVTPKVGAGLPIAAAIAAGNPAVGAAIWLFDKASGSKISEISRYKYKVSGTWNAPKIDEIIVKKESKNEHENDKAE